MFLYYHENINSNYCDAEYVDARNWREFTSFLPICASADYSDMKTGMNSYLASRSLPKNTTYIKTNNIIYNVWNKMKSCISNNKPCIIGLASHPTYGNHWVVGTGYRIYESDNKTTGVMIDTSYYRINDGWGNQIVYVNTNYVDGVIYIE